MLLILTTHILIISGNILLDTLLMFIKLKHMINYAFTLISMENNRKKDDCL